MNHCPALDEAAHKGKAPSIWEALEVEQLVLEAFAGEKLYPRSIRDFRGSVGEGGLLPKLGLINVTY